MKISAKKLKTSNFILYDLEDNIICYLDNYEELNKYINYTPRKLAYEYNSRNTDIITVIIDNQKLKLATFC